MTGVPKVIPRSENPHRNPPDAEPKIDFVQREVPHCLGPRNGANTAEGRKRMLSNARRNLTLLLVVALGTGMIDTALAADSSEQYPSSLEQKLGAGLVNTATGWVELIKSPVAITKKGGIGWGITLGPLMGVVHTVGRTACGLFDLVTFILPTKPLVKPRMIWQDFDIETTYNPEFEFYDQ